MMEKIFGHDRWKTSFPEGSVKCDCLSCSFCDGKIQEDDCPHGEDDKSCPCRFCDCGRRMTNWESEVGDLCGFCFATFNYEHFNNKPYAVFVGFQDNPDNTPFPLFDIRGDHPMHNKTVSAEVLFREKIDLPWIPDFDDWLKWRKDADGRRL